MTATPLGDDVVGLGRRAQHTLRHTLERDLGDQAAITLQEAGYAAGDETYVAFSRWLADYAGVSDPAELDADTLSDVLGAFFRSLGWGNLRVERLGAAALAVDSSDWAEAEPDTRASAPSCHISAGLLASLFGRIADQDVAVMEIECRTRNDPRCRFLAGAQDTLQEVYAAMSEGKDYREVLGVRGAP
jgi:hypothetical protein